MARWPGEGVVAGRTQARRKRSWRLPGRTTILGRRLARTGRSPLCSASSRRRVKKGCCKHIFQVFQMFHRYAASVSYGCCKSRSGCCIWLYTYVASFCSQCFICFFHTYVPSVFIWMLQMFHILVASVLSRLKASRPLVGFR